MPAILSDAHRGCSEPRSCACTLQANSEELQLLKERVVRCFEAGALATGCEFEVSWLVKDYEFVRMNPTIGAVYEANLEGVFAL